MTGSSEIADFASIRSLTARADELAALLDPPRTNKTVPKPEHPRPTLARSLWINLNGEWEFEIDPSDSGRERGLLQRKLSGTITVPFAPESKLSGVENRDFMEAVWYRKKVTIPSSWKATELRPILHFGAVDHDATVWVNGTEVARHRGGFTPFSADLNGIVSGGQTAEIVVRARDSRIAPQARGKQATWYDSTHCQYTRTTGIWQTVWLEAVPHVHIRSLRIFPSVENESFNFVVPISANAPGLTLKIEIANPGAAVIARRRVAVRADLSAQLEIAIPKEHVRLWEVGNPQLYSVSAQLIDDAGRPLDRVSSYCGLRSTALHGQRFLLNGKKTFQRLVLDQGYWPDSLMTAPCDAAIKRDIRIALAAGFNGARLHQKVFEERMLFWADLHGYLLWGEFGDWGVSGRGPLGYNQEPTASFLTQWTEVLERDISHPSIIGWCPLNETHQVLHDRITVLDDVTQGMYQLTKLADPTRPVLDASGYAHRVRNADIYDSHSYEQDPKAFYKEQSGLADGNPYINRVELAPNQMPFADGNFSLPYAGQPFFISEFGGIWWNEDEALAQTHANDQTASWGYGDRVRTLEEFYERFAGLVGVLADMPQTFGYCYTQLTDVFQEKNGIVAFDRSLKLDVQRIRAIQARPAAYES
ncbi:MAG: glycoside hydrolase family 2 TIM barrel-domain containing protein [Winkia neuii]|uniref:glycoside hydrolase family 2 protein n=1 Tax=Winkia neuii TaxID=33007 RepID=UPI002903D4CB|nr:sugar-binding domain-containing protein [Winkia neuii]MDU3135506.1 glycoside hydrolase family 2 TIM barrel-domain containing protein [Winkia neuii]